MTKKKIKALDIPIEELEIDLATILLEDLLVAIGGVIFSGASLKEIDTNILEHLKDLIEAERKLRKIGNRKDETLH